MLFNSSYCSYKKDPELNTIYKKTKNVNFPDYTKNWIDYLNQSQAKKSNFINCKKSNVTKQKTIL